MFLAAIHTSSHYSAVAGKKLGATHLDNELSDLLNVMRHAASLLHDSQHVMVGEIDAGDHLWTHKCWLMIRVLLLSC